MDPYKILGIDKTATLDEIQRAYRAKAMKHHPDRGGDAWAFQHVREAYEKLVRLHQTGSSGAARPAPRSKPTPPHPKQQSTTRTPPPPRQPPNAKTPPNQPAKPIPPPQRDAPGTPSEAISPWWRFALRELPLQNETTTFILVNVIDIFVTYALIRFGGVEANPVARFFLDRWGIDGLVYFKMTMVAFVTVLAQIIARSNLKRGQLVLRIGAVIVVIVVVYSLLLLARNFGR